MRLLSSDRAWKPSCPKAVLFLVMAAVLGAGLWLRLVSASELQVREPLWGDAGEYFRTAYNLRFRGVYGAEDPGSWNPSIPVAPDALRSPGYPLFLLPFVDGPPSKRIFFNIALAQALLGTLTLGIAFLFFRSFLSPFWAVAASLLTALSPHLIVMGSYLLSETLSTFLWVLGAFLFSRFAEKRNFPFVMLAGGVLGLAALVRPSLLYFPFFVFFWLWISGKTKVPSRPAMVFLAGFLVVLSPFTVRNLIVLGKPSDSTRIINFLHHGMYPRVMHEDRAETFGAPDLFDPASSHAQEGVGAALSEIAGRFRREPAKHLSWYILEKPLFFFSWNLVQGHGIHVYTARQSPFDTRPVFRAVRAVMKILHIPLVVLGFLGAVLAWMVKGKKGLLSPSLLSVRFASLLLLYYIVIDMAGFPLPRYSIPLRPLLYGLACFGVVIMFRRNRGGEHE